MFLFVAGPGIAPGPGAYETPELLLLYPAVSFSIKFLLFWHLMKCSLFRADDKSLNSLLLYPAKKLAFIEVVYIKKIFLARGTEKGLK